MPGDVVPLLELKEDDHFVACHFPQVRADIAAAVDVGVTAEEVAVEQAEEGPRPRSRGPWPTAPGTGGAPRISGSPLDQG